MIYVIGVRSFTTDGRPGKGLIAQCGRCGRVGEFRQAIQWTFLHLFWIPLIPVWLTRARKCQNCQTLFKTNDPWYRSLGVLFYLLIFATPVWALLLVTDKMQSVWVKIIAVVLSIPYILLVGGAILAG